MCVRVSCVLSLASPAQPMPVVSLTGVVLLLNEQEEFDPLLFPIWPDSPLLRQPVLPTPRRSLSRRARRTPAQNSGAQNPLM